MLWRYSAARLLPALGSLSKQKARTGTCLFRRVQIISKSDHYLRHVRPSIRMEQLGSHTTDFH